MTIQPRYSSEGGAEAMMRDVHEQYRHTIARLRSKNLSLGERQIDFGAGFITIFYVNQITERCSL
jgi:hypothetical protein